MTQTPSKSDPTTAALVRQVDAMGCDLFELGIRDGRSGKMMLRSWSRDELLGAIGWLKRQNLHGQDIYIRPKGSRGLVLVDDLTPDATRRMTADGIEPSAVIETSPGNFQAWVRVSKEPIPERLATAVARELAREYAGDPASADWRHFGRLAGFTNRKKVHQKQDGRFPFVLTHECRWRVATRGHHLLERAREELLDEAEAARERLRRVEAIQREGSAPEASGPVKNPVRAYRQYMYRLIRKYGPTTTDFSRADWMVCKKMINDGFERHEIQEALLAASPDLAERKPSHVQDYMERTVRKVFELFAAADAAGGELPLVQLRVSRQEGISLTNP